MIPAMAKQGIPAAYGAALVAMSAVMDPLIPPSITMIVFGVLSGASIGQMFIAGIVRTVRRRRSGHGLVADGPDVANE